MSEVPRRRTRLLALAADEVARFGAEAIAVEHLLLAIVRPERGVGAALLGAVGVDPRAVVAETERRAPRGPAAPPPGQVPLEHGVKGALERAVERAKAIGHAERATGVEHLLLALADEGPALASRVLRDEGVDRERLRDAVVALHDAADGAFAEAATDVPWTPSARRAVIGALAASASAGDAEAGVRRLVATLLEEEDVAGALDAAGVRPGTGPAESATPASSLPRGWPPVAFEAWPSFDRAAREALRRAALAAKRLGSGAATAAHLLLAATRDASAAAAVFGERVELARDALWGLCGVDPARAAEESLGGRATAPDSIAAPPPGAASFFSPEAAAALAEAVRLARRYGGRVRTSHLFFGLCRGGAIGAALRAVPGGAAFERDALRPLEDRALGDEGGGAPAVDLDPSLLAAVSVAMASAASGGRASVDAQDLLLALLVDDGAPARLLREAGVDLLALRRSLEEE